MVLGYIGQSPLEEPFLSLGKISTFFFFAYFLLIKIAGSFDEIMLKYLKNNGFPFRNFFGKLESLKENKAFFIWVLILIIDLKTNKVHSIYDEGDISLALSFYFFLPSNFHKYLQRYIEWRQNIYDTFTIYILKKRYISSLLLYYHKILYVFSYNLEDLANSFADIFRSQYLQLAYLFLPADYI
jgi:hypothetical protein